MSTFPLNAALPLSANLIGRWLLDEASGNRADSSGNALTLTDTNTVGVRTGLSTLNTSYSNAADFIRTNSEALVRGDDATLSLTGSITIIGWIFADDSTFGNIMAKFTSTGNQRSYRLANQGVSGLFGGISVDGSTEKQSGSSGYSISAWHQVAMVFEASTRLDFYIDGLLSVHDTTSIPASIFNSTAGFALGCENVASTPVNFFDGGMQDQMIFNTAATDAQILATYRLWVPATASVGTAFFM